VAWPGGLPFAASQSVSRIGCRVRSLLGSLICSLQRRYSQRGLRDRAIPVILERPAGLFGQVRKERLETAGRPHEKTQGRTRYPADWRATRQRIKEKYTRYDGAERDRNGCELNTAGVIGAMLYGQNDFIATATCAFNFGWDADNNAATACTIIGVLKGYRWMMAQRWDIKDLYRNTSRDKMPAVETIAGFADRILALAGQAITENGGKKLTRNGEIFYQIPLQAPENVEPLTDAQFQFVELRTRLFPEIESGILESKNPADRAKAAYMAICLDWASAFRINHPAQWAQALEALDGYPKLMRLLFSPRVPPGEALRDKAVAAGLLHSQVLQIRPIRAVPTKRCRDKFSRPPVMPSMCQSRLRSGVETPEAR
jgi:hypothetical protein